jgi:hypothetical protein
MNLAESEVQAHGQSVCINSGGHLAGQSVSRTADVLFSVSRDAGPCWCTRTTDVSIICTVAYEQRSTPP